MSFNEARVTSVGLQDPQPGTYTIEPMEGSAAITNVSEAEDPPDAKVKAKVEGSGDRRTLEYDIRNRPDQRVAFFDVTPGGAEKQIGTVKGGGQGSLRFSPAPGKGRHQVVAQVYLADLPAISMVLGAGTILARFIFIYVPKCSKMLRLTSS
jgi:hypothetical protein